MLSKIIQEEWEVGESTEAGKVNKYMRAGICLNDDGGEFYNIKVYASNEKHCIIRLQLITNETNWEKSI